METKGMVASAAFAVLLVGVLARPVLGDEEPKAVNTKGLPQLGDTWKDKDPFEGNKVAIEVGTSAYNQNCARCHGLEMISGGLAPDLRYVPLGAEGDDIFKDHVLHGVQRNGTTVMPKFAGLLPQETLWSVRAYMVSMHVDN